MKKTILTRRDFLKTAAASGLAAGAAGGLAAAPKQKGKPPNIVLIMADDLGYECLGANGGTSYKTPRLDRLAGEGIRFEHCYSQPLCTPSRAKIMTGIYNVRNYVQFGILDKEQTTFAHLLKKAGYATCIVGKWQLGKDRQLPHHFGFDDYCLWQVDRRPSRYPNPGLEINGEQVTFTNGEYAPDVVSDFAIDFIKKNKDKPFLVYYPMILTHCPFEPTPDSADWDPKSKGSKTYKGDAKYFGDMVAYMDKIVGKIVDELEKLGLRENTLLLFTGDNGTDTPVISQMGGRAVKAGKGQMDDAGTRVPFLANWPGAIPGGRVCGDLVDFSDFLPTLCECAGVAVPEKLKIDGRSFLPRLLGKKANPREWIYIWYARNGKTNIKEFARDQSYKLYRDGKFYFVAGDVLEKKPLAEGELDGEAKKARKKLQVVLDRYENARPQKLRAKKKPVRKAK